MGFGNFRRVYDAFELASRMKTQEFKIAKKMDVIDI